MIEHLISWDTSLFLFLNGHNTPFWDAVMLFFSGKLSWLPLYLILAYAIAKKYKWTAIWWLVAIGFVVLASDQLSVQLFKNVFQRLRPCHDPDLMGMIHLVGRCGGKFGFVSSHAANTFGVAVFLSLLFKKGWFSLSIIFWALVVSFSRIYLGVHFPADVICGGILGAGVGIAIFVISDTLINRKKLVFRL